MQRTTLEAAQARFKTYSIVDPETGCWVWTRSLDRQGYGKFCHNYKTWKAHSWSYLWWGAEPYDPELERDHLCRNKACVNPEHLEQVTHQVNAQRRDAVKTHCPQGHPYTDLLENGHRRCRICKADHEKKYRLQRKVAV